MIYVMLGAVRDGHHLARISHEHFEFKLQLFEYFKKIVTSQRSTVFVGLLQKVHPYGPADFSASASLPSICGRLLQLHAVLFFQIFFSLPERNYQARTVVFQVQHMGSSGIAKPYGFHLFS